ncbi:MinD/ParA family protein [Virgibacillus dakarensis]
MMPDDQAAKLRQKLAVKNNQTHAKTIAIVSGKGGVGKSNFALNFALELLDKRKKVLLFDLDVGMGNIDILLGMQTNKTIVDMLADQLAFRDCLEIGPNNLDYIAAGSGLSEFFTMDKMKMNYFLEQYNDLIPKYDYIIFDMGAGTTSDSLAFVMAADECIVVTTPEPTSITDAYGMTKHIVNKQRNMPIYVVMNRSRTAKFGTKVLNQFQRVVFRFLQVNVFPMGVLPDDKTVQTAVTRQIPYLLLNSKAPVSRALKQIVTSYLANEISLNQQESLSFVQKVKRFMTERNKQ